MADPVAPVKAAGAAGKESATAAAKGAKGIGSKLKGLPPWAWIAGGGVGLLIFYQMSKGSGGATAVDPNAADGYAYSSVPNFSIPTGDGSFGQGSGSSILPPAIGDTAIPGPPGDAGPQGPAGSPGVDAPVPVFPDAPAPIAQDAAVTGGGAPARPHPADSHTSKAAQTRRAARAAAGVTDVRKATPAQKKKLQRKGLLPNKKSGAKTKPAAHHKTAPKKQASHKPKRKRR